MAGCGGPIVAGGRATETHQPLAPVGAPPSYRAFTRTAARSSGLRRARPNSSLIYRSAALDQQPSSEWQPRPARRPEPAGRDDGFGGRGAAPEEPAHGVAEVLVDLH